MNKYSVDVKEINPMETAPVWDYYNGDVEVVCLFYKTITGRIANTFGFFDRDLDCWLDYYSSFPIEEELVGWLPDYQYVGIIN